RERFSGEPEFVQTFFEFIAQEVREHLAALGYRTMDEAIGQVERIDVSAAVTHWKAQGLDLAPILKATTRSPGVGRRFLRQADHGLERTLDASLISMCQPALELGEPVRAQLAVRNVHRAVGTMLGFEVTARHGGAGLPDGTIDLTFVGSAGQSFGAFLPQGITLRLQGDANDYVGKGLSGGRIVVRPAREATFTAADNIIAGNVIGYGATQGELYLRGQVGERFCVRNSGAKAVVEGVGDHALEYMTGGVVVILGPTGRNLGAGMSGGVAYVMDLDPVQVNPEMVELERLAEQDIELVHALVLRHAQETDSEVAQALAQEWDGSVSRFTKVMPRDYKRVLALTEQSIEQGADPLELLMGVGRG
ncbi:MAG: glutamate synthase subunit alpha, partial [Actinomycetales bacterium]